MARKLTKRPLSGGPAKTTHKPKKSVTLRPIPSDKLIRDPSAPRPATWRGGKKKTTSPLRRRSR